jgi:hypothetical protein
MYVLIKNDEAYHSEMLTPLARIAGVERRTIKRWLDNPSLALRKGYSIYQSTKAPHNKTGNPNM